MNSIDNRRERYMQDLLPVRIGGIAANLARLSSISGWPDSQTVAFDLFEESKHFIEWTARDAEMETTGLLIELQLQLALWQRRLDENWADETCRSEIGRRAKQYSIELLQRSGLFGKQ